MSTAPLSHNEPTAVLHVTHPDGRELEVIVCLAPTDSGLVVYLDPDGWEPTPDLLRVNVGDGPAFNYPTARRWYGDDLGHPFPGGAQ